MARPRTHYTCLPCRDEDGKGAVRATYRLLVRKVGDKLGHEVWGCKIHIAQLFASIIKEGKPLDVIVHNVETGECMGEAHLRQEG